MSKNKDRVAVLGCGWLGMEVATELVNEKFKVNGSTTSSGKLITLKTLGVNPYLLNINDEINSKQWVEFLNVDSLFINLPPTKASTENQTYSEGFEKILPLIVDSEIKHVVFVSATSVYKDNNGIVTEESELSDSVRAQRLIDAETVFLNSTSFTTTIIRFSGLVGKERNPVKFLSGRKEIEGKNYPVNLIHLTDCVRIALLAMKSQSNGIYNAASDKHPTKGEYYSKMAQLYNLEPPHFGVQSNNSEMSYKLIKSEKLKNQFNYHFTYADPLLFD